MRSGRCHTCCFVAQAAEAKAAAAEEARQRSIYEQEAQARARAEAAAAKAAKVEAAKQEVTISTEHAIIHPMRTRLFTGCAQARDKREAELAAFFKEQADEEASSDLVKQHYSQMLSSGPH